MNPTKPTVIAPAGEHTHTEVILRITTTDGRITDHGPYLLGAGSTIESFKMAFRMEPGARMTKLARTVTTIAGPWEPVMPNGGGQ